MSHFSPSWATYLADEATPLAMVLEEAAANLDPSLAGCGRRAAFEHSASAQAQGGGGG